MVRKLRSADPSRWAHQIVQARGGCGRRRHEAAADEGNWRRANRRRRVHRWCRAERSVLAEEPSCGSAGLGFPLGSPDPGIPATRARTATAAKRSGCRGARTMAKVWALLRARCGHASSSAASSPSRRAAGDNDSQTRAGASAFSRRVASASFAARTSNLRLPETLTRSAWQPSSIRRSRVRARFAPARD